MAGAFSLAKAGGLDEAFRAYHELHQLHPILMSFISLSVYHKFNARSDGAARAFNTIRFFLFAQSENYTLWTQRPNEQAARTSEEKIIIIETETAILLR